MNPPKHETYCNFCGGLFLAGDASRRCCSQRCVNGLGQRYQLDKAAARRASSDDPGATGKRTGVLMLLRAKPGQWVTERHLALGLYGDARLSSRMALRALIYRTNAVFGLFGLRIEHLSANEGNRTLALYCLTSDVEIENVAPCGDATSSVAS
jgi:hypothetical protein